MELFPYRSVMKKKLLVRSRCAGAVRNMLNSDEQDDLTSEGNHTEVELESVPGNLGFEVRRSEVILCRVIRADALCRS